MSAGYDIQNNVLVEYSGSETKIVIPDGVIEIGDRAFQGQEKIVSVVMPETVVKIGTQAFRKCIKLKEISFSPNITEIRQDAFCGCIALKEAVLPKTLKTLKSGVFAGCKKLTKVVCESTEFIPKSDPFYSSSYYKYPESIVDENGYIIFAKTLFSYIGKSKEMVVPDGVERLANDLFGFGKYNRETEYNIESVVLPESVKFIGNRAFTYCRNLKSIKMPSGIEIAANAFRGCSGLADENGFFIYDGVALAYMGDSDTVIVPDGTKVVSEELFAFNEKIHAVNFPDTLEEIGNRAFKGCTLLEKIVIPNSVKKIGSEVFEGCNHLVSVVMPDTIEEIGNWAFEGCTLLEKIVIPNSVKKIGSEVFKECNHLVSVVMPDAIEEMGERIFIGCRSLADENGFVIENNSIHSFYSSNRKIVIPEGIVSIADSVFDKTGITSIQLPSTLRTLGSAFNRCDSLTEIIIPEGVEVIRSYTFAGCIRLKRVVLPSTIKYIGYRAFNCCEKLEEIIIPDCVKIIKGCAFAGCKSLKSVCIPCGVQEIGDDAFNGCTSLVSVQLNEGLLKIGKCAFKDCENIAEITIPTTVKKIDYRAFENCKALKKLNCEKVNGTVDRRAFDGCIGLSDENGMTIIAGILWKYDGPGGDVIVPEGIISLAPNVFREGSLKSVVLPSTVKQIYRNAFDGCKALTSINIPDGVEIIGEEAFRECGALKSISLPASVESIGDMAFGGCKGLSAFSVSPENSSYSVQDDILLNKAGDTLVWFPAGKKITEYVIPENISAIARHAFIDCVKLQKIVIPATVCTIEDEVFPRNDWHNKFSFVDIEVDPKAGSCAVGSEVFDFGDSDTPLKYPKLPVTFVKEKKVQVRLGLGYCQNSGEYTGEYAEIYKKYAKSHKKALFKKADASILSDIVKYYSTDLSEDASGKAKKINYKKLSNQAKVEMLEKVIIQDDIDQARQVIEGCGSFEFTARALGLACLYSSLEMVKTIVAGGATFSYEYTSVLKRKYGVAYVTRYKKYPVNYSSLIAKTKVGVNTHEFHFGTLPKVDKKENPENVRADIAEYLLTQPKAKFDSAEALFYSILWGCTGVADRLIEKGVKLNNHQIYLLTSTSNGYNEVWWTLPTLSASKAEYALKTFITCLEGTGLKIIPNQSVYESEKTSMLNADVLRCLFAEADTSKIKKSKVLEMVIDKNDVKALEVIIEAGVIKTTAQREKAIAYATKQKKNDVLAWLMDYKNRTADIAAEEAKEEKKMFRELTQDPNSVSALKKKWSYKKLEDGTLQITSYKGSDLEVEVPATIGKAKVTVIGKGAFDASDYAGSRNEHREKIQKIVIPEGIIEIGEEAFYQCESLTSVVIPEGVIEIGEEAFYQCGSLTSVVIPEGVIEIGKEAFYGCKSLTSVVLPSTLKKIGDYAFAYCNELVEIAIPESTNMGIRVFQRCDKLYNRDGLAIIDGVLYSYSTPESKDSIVMIPDGVSRIGQSAFEDANLVEIRIPNTVTTIGSKAFFKCSKLRDIYIPASVTKLGKDVLGIPDDYKGDFRDTYKPISVYVHTPAGSMAEEYMKQYDGVYIDNDYPEE